MKTDTERLDWLAENQESIIGKFVYRSLTGDYEFVGWTTSRRNDECPTPRGAIDAAMNAGVNDD